MNPYSGPNPFAEANPTIARYLAGEVPLETAATELARIWKRWAETASALDLTNADPVKLHALWERATAMLEQEQIKEGAQEYLATAGNSPFDQVVRLLAHDVTTTVGEQYVPVVWRFAAEARRLDIEDPATKVVEDVQQFFQDTFVDTTWPGCPHHPNHPLDYAEGSWRCPRDGAVVASLGGL